MGLCRVGYIGGVIETITIIGCGLHRLDVEM